MVSSSSSSSSQAAAPLAPLPPEASSQKIQKVAPAGMSPAEKALREKLAELFTSVDPKSLDPRSLTCDYLGKRELRYLAWQPTLPVPLAGGGGASIIPFPETCSLSHIRFRETALEHFQAYPSRSYSVLLLRDTAMRTMIVDARAAINWIEQHGTSPGGDGKDQILSLDHFLVGSAGSFQKSNELSILNKKIVNKDLSPISVALITQAALLHYSEKAGETLKDAQEARKAILKRRLNEDSFLFYMNLYLHDLGDASDGGFARERLRVFIGQGPKEYPAVQTQTLQRIGRLETGLSAYAMVHILLGDYFSNENRAVFYNFALACKHYKRALEIEGTKSSNSDLVHKLIVALGRNSQYDEAITYAEQALQAAPSATAHLDLACLLLCLKNVDFAKVEQHVQKALPEKSKTSLMQFCLGKIHRLKNELHQAKECFEKAIGLGPLRLGKGHYHYGSNLALGEIYFAEKNYQKVIDYLAVLWLEGNYNREIFELLVKAYVKTGAYDNARTLANMALLKKLYPNREAVVKLFYSEQVGEYEAAKAAADTLLQSESVREYETLKSWFAAP